MDSSFTDYQSNRIFNRTLKQLFIKVENNIKKMMIFEKQGIRLYVMLNPKQKSIKKFNHVNLFNSWRSRSHMNISKSVWVSVSFRCMYLLSIFLGFIYKSNLSLKQFLNIFVNANRYCTLNITQYVAFRISHFMTMCVAFICRMNQPSFYNYG